MRSVRMSCIRRFGSFVGCYPIAVKPGTKMQFHNRPSAPFEPHSNSAYPALACLSPIGGGMSSIIVIGCACSASGYLFAGSLQPLFGFAGALFILLVASVILERISRPFVLWVLGRHVYLSILRIGGKAAADAVASVYASGGKLNQHQFETLMNGSAMDKDQ